MIYKTTFVSFFVQDMPYCGVRRRTDMSPLPPDESGEWELTHVTTTGLALTESGYPTESDYASLATGIYYTWKKVST